MATASIQIIFGATAQPLKDQLKKFKSGKTDFQYYQEMADAITKLNIHSLISDSSAETARKKLMKNILKDLA